MRLPRVRFTVRRLMVGVCVAAVAVGAERMARRRQAYLARAAPHAFAEQVYADLALGLAADPAASGLVTVTALLPDGSAVRFDGHGPGRRIFVPPDAPGPADEATAARLADLCRREAGRERRLRLKYERAARTPWLPLPAEPPDPDAEWEIYPYPPPGNRSR